VPVRFQTLLTLVLSSFGLMLLGLIDGGSITQVLVIPLVVVLPGFAITAALFRRSLLTTVEQVLLSLGLSLALVVLSGFVLDWTFWGLQTVSWAILLGSITLIVGGIAFFRYRRNPAPPVSRISLQLNWLNLRPLILFTLAGLIVVAALVVTRNGALNQSTPGFTQLWLLPESTVNQGQLRLGFNNQEGTVETYRLQVNNGSTNLQEWATITLKPSEQWETTFTLPAGLPSGEKIEASLYKANAPDTVYREVTYNVP
jgi:uncharacterized membrane protein